MVVQQTNKVTTVLTICKYETYQAEHATDETTGRTTDDTTGGQQTDNKRDTNKKNNNDKNDENKDIPPSPPKGEGVPFQDIVNLYHQHLPMLPKVVNINDTRKRAMKARWSESVNIPSGDDVISMKCNSLDFWARYFRRASTQPFLTGDVTEWNADFDFLIKKTNFIKVIENKYAREK